MDIQTKDTTVVSTAALESLKRMVEELERDAARYRWLRTAGAWESEIGMDLLSINPCAFDDAIDAEMLANPIKSSGEICDWQHKMKHE